MIFRATHYSDNKTAVAVYDPELKHSDYSGMFTLPTDRWKAFRGCMEVGVEGNPLGFVVEFYEGTPDSPARLPT